MTLDLYLIRHAKSGWDDLLVTDHDRRLTDRGHRSAKAVGQWLDERPAALQQVICSTAFRAVDTWEEISGQINATPQVHMTRDIYLADPMTMLTAIRAASAPVLCLIGHNPGIAAIAENLAQGAFEHSDFHRFPTCATAHLRFENLSWNDVLPGQGEVVDFVTPRELLAR